MWASHLVKTQRCFGRTERWEQHVSMERKEQGRVLVRQQKTQKAMSQVVKHTHTHRKQLWANGNVWRLFSGRFGLHFWAGALPGDGTMPKEVTLITLAGMNRWCKSLGFEEHSNMFKLKRFLTTLRIDHLLSTKLFLKWMNLVSLYKSWLPGYKLLFYSTFTNTRPECYDQRLWFL